VSAIAALAVVGAGFGGNGRPASKHAVMANGVAAARAAIRQLSGPVAWAAPGPSFNAGAAEGKSVWVVDLNMSIPFNKIITDSIKEALQAAGVKVTLCDGKGTPQGWSQCSGQALASHPSVIIDQSITPKLIGADLEKATKQGIHVIEGNIHDPSSKKDLTKGAIGGVAFPFVKVGKLMADWAIADTNGKANVIIVTSSDVPNATDIVDQGAKPEFKKLCPACKVKVVDVPVSDWATQMTSNVQSAIAADPSVNYVLPIYDGMTTFVTPAIVQAGASSRIKEVSFNADLGPMKDLVAGKQLAADVGISVPWQGWQYADQALRVITGHKPVIEHTPIRVFTRANSKELPLTVAAQASGRWYGSVNFKQKFKQLWGLK
jgi:ribose transport system substrate-binding protein